MIKTVFLSIAALLWAFILLFPVQRLQSIHWTVAGISVPIYYFLISVPTLAIVVYTFATHRPRTSWQWAWWLFPLTCLPGIWMGENRLWAMREWVSLWLRGLALGASLACLLDSFKPAERILRWIYPAAVAACLFGLAELAFNRNPLTDDYVGHDVASYIGPATQPNFLYHPPGNFAGSERPLGTQGNRIPYVMCIVAFAPLALWQLERGGRWKWLYGAVFFALILWAHVLTGWVGFLVALVAYIALMDPRQTKTRRRILFGTAGLLFISVLLPPSRSALVAGAAHLRLDNPDIQHRLASLAVVRVLEQGPFFGVGYGNYGRVYQPYYKGPLPFDSSPDNQHLRWLVENGVVGYVTLLAFLIYLVTVCLRRITRLSSEEGRAFYQAVFAGWISMAVMLLFFDGLNWIGPNMTFWFLLGILSGCLPRKRPEPSRLFLSDASSPPEPRGEETMCSIIIPTYNTRELTLACLERIQKYPPPGPYEILVVDNNSTDSTFDQVRERFPQVVALRNSGNLGFARACNRGAQMAKGNYVLFLNSDTEALEGTFKILLDWMKTHPGTGIAGPELIGFGENLLQMSWSWYPLLGRELIHRYFAPQNIGPSKLKQRLIRYLQRQPRSVPFICGACLLIRRDVFDRLSGFDETFELYFEDADLCWRCAEAGWTVDFVPRSKIVHHIGRSTKGTWNMSSLIYQQSHIAYYRKHAPAWSVLFLKCYLLLKWFRLVVDAHREQKEPLRARIYCRSYLRVIFESMRFALDTHLTPGTSKGHGEKVPLTWNRAVQILSRVTLTRRGLFKNLLLPHVEFHESLFGRYRFRMDLSMGWLQKIYFLKPDVYEWESQEALRRWLRPGMTVLDIGAHTGYMTLLLADLVGPHGRVYAFEPASRIFALLKTNIESNHLSHVSIFQMALSDRTSWAPLYINPVNDGNNSLGNMKDSPDFSGMNLEEHRETVPTDTLDHFLGERGIAHVDLIKIDVEGAELLVFSGARELLMRSDAPPIICEVGDINEPYFGQREEDLRKLLYSLGYRSFWIESFREFGPETPVHGLRNVLFSKTFF